MTKYSYNIWSSYEFSRINFFLLWTYCSCWALMKCGCMLQLLTMEWTWVSIRGFHNPKIRKLFCCISKLLNKLKYKEGKTIYICSDVLPNCNYQIHYFFCSWEVILMVLIYMFATKCCIEYWLIKSMVTYLFYCYVLQVFYLKLILNHGLYMLFFLLHISLIWVKTLGKNVHVYGKSTKNRASFSDIYLTCTPFGDLSSRNYSYLTTCHC